MVSPRAIILINGKRKCGKDYFAERLASEFDDDICQIIHLSEEIKREYAKLKGLDYELLLTDAPYKDKYRHDMIALGETYRNPDPGHYCRLATQNCTASVWIVVDNRRLTDICYFKDLYPDTCLVVRVCADDSTRGSRGWKWQDGVDNTESECGLDGYKSDVIVQNGGTDSDKLERGLKSVIDWIRDKLKS